MSGEFEEKSNPGVPLAPPPAAILPNIKSSPKNGSSTTSGGVLNELLKKTERQKDHTKSRDAHESSKFAGDLYHKRNKLEPTDDEKIVKIVCISDTHLKHNRLEHNIPKGDILIHAGDFSTRLRDEDFKSTLEDFNNFLGRLKHKHKIVIGGNHEIALNNYQKEEIQALLSNCIYLQDESCRIEGILFYGSPWTASHRMGFSCSRDQLRSKWKNIPSDVDVLITHSPPFNIRDLADTNHSKGKDDRRCDVCGKIHPRKRHWGDKSLLERIQTVQPLVHIFGHVHGGYGYTNQDGVLFVNAAMDLEPPPIWLNYRISSADIEATYHDSPKKERGVTCCVIS